MWFLRLEVAFQVVVLERDAPGFHLGNQLLDVVDLKTECGMAGGGLDALCHLPRKKSSLAATRETLPIRVWSRADVGERGLRPEVTLVGERCARR